MNEASKEQAMLANEAPKQTVNDVQETVSKFESKIAYAKMAGEEWMETSPEIIKFYNPTGLGDAKYFSYQGILVCENGKVEECKEAMRKNLNKLINGPEEGTRL